MGLMNAILALCTGLTLVSTLPTTRTDVPPTETESESENMAAELPEDAQSYANIEDFTSKEEDVNYPAANFVVEDEKKTKKPGPTVSLVLAISFGAVALIGIIALIVRRIKYGIY